MKYYSRSNVLFDHNIQRREIPIHRLRVASPDIDPRKSEVFKKLSSNLKRLSPERIYSEFKKILLCNNLYEVLSLMKKSKLLKYIIVEDNDLKRVKNLKKICKSTQLIDFSTLLSILIKEKNLLKVFNNMNLLVNDIFYSPYLSF